jgi:hypothetical protein
MNSQARPRAVVGLQWVVGLVLIVESLRLGLDPTAARHFAQAGMPLWMRPALAWAEIAAAILFLVPFTTLLGGWLPAPGDLLFRGSTACLARRIRRAAGLQHGGAGKPALPGRHEVGSGA